MFRGPPPNNRSVVISTTDVLRKELELLNQMAWQADEDTILRWGETDGYPTDGVYGPAGKINTASIQEHTEYDTQSLAKFSFSLFWHALRFAEEQQVPILLDF